MLLVILVVLLFLALFGGSYGYGRGWGMYGWSPFGLIFLLILLALVFGWHV